MKYQSFVAALAAVAFACAPTASQAQDKRVLKRWLSDQFQSVATLCLPGVRFRPDQNFIPKTIREASILAGRLDQTHDVYGSANLNDMFRTVEVQGTTGWVATPDRLGMIFESGNVLFDEDVSSIKRGHNCTALLSGSADLGLTVPLADLKAMFAGRIEGKDQQSTYVYAGKMASPYTVAFGINTSFADLPSSIDAFTAWLTLWHWYRAKPNYVLAGEGGKLRIADEVTGVAVYRISGLTQDVLLSAAGEAGVKVPFFEAKGEARASIRSLADTKIEDFSVAVWSTNPKRLPSPTEVISGLAGYSASRFTWVKGDPEYVDSATPQWHSIDLRGVPSGFCKPLFWRLEAMNASGVNVTTSDMRANPMEGRVCRFSVLVSPNATATGSAVVGFNLVSEIPAAARTETQPARPAMKLVLSTPIKALPDYRSDVTPEPARAPSAFEFPRSSTSGNLMTAIFPLKEKTDGRLKDLRDVSFEINCGVAGPRSLSVRSGLTRSSSELFLTATFDIPNDLIGEVATECAINGKTRLVLNTGAVTEPVALPGFKFVATRAPAPAPRS